jgi:hypothetical protein
MDPDLIKLAQQLKDKTEQGEATWSTTSLDEQFALKLSTGSVLVDFFKGSSEYSIAVVSKTGVKVREGRVSKGDLAFSVLKELYDTAYRKHHRIDETFDAVIREATQPGKVGEDDDLPF